MAWRRTLAERSERTQPRASRHGRHGREGPKPRRAAAPPAAGHAGRPLRPLRRHRAGVPLPSAWPELRDVRFEVAADMPAATDDDGIPRWTVCPTPGASSCTACRSSVSAICTAMTSRTGACSSRAPSFRAAAEYLDRDPWDLGPERFRYLTRPPSASPPDPHPELCERGLRDRRRSRPSRRPMATPAHPPAPRRRRRTGPPARAPRLEPVHRARRRGGAR